MSRGKPRHHAGYTPEELLQVRSACLTVAVTLGAHLDHLCIVGGLAPSLLIDERLGPDPTSGVGHPGTNDLDVAMKLVVLRDRAYAEISTRLRQEGFGPGTNQHGNPTPQRWSLDAKNVVVDFLLPPVDGGPAAGAVQALEPDFGALVIPGTELVADERELVSLTGHTLTGERVSRTVPVCGPGAFAVLKALAFSERGEPKDAFDLVYVIRRWPSGVDDIASRLVRHADGHGVLVRGALARLAADFHDPDHLGPRRAAEFEAVHADDLDPAAADAHGYVDDLLRACARIGLRPT